MDPIQEVMHGLDLLRSHVGENDIRFEEGVLRIETEHPDVPAATAKVLLENGWAVDAESGRWYYASR